MATISDQPIGTTKPFEPEPWDPNCPACLSGIGPVDPKFCPACLSGIGPVEPTDPVIAIAEPVARAS